MNPYLLPCSPAVLRQDRFDLLESDEAEVSFWRILEATLTKKATCCADLIDQLQTIAVTLRGSLGGCDYEFLESFLSNRLPVLLTNEDGQHFFKHVWPKLVDLALEMPSLFPGSSLRGLSHEYPQVVLSRRQVACLVIHQFLGSLPSQPWETDSHPDFTIWYSSNIKNGHSGAVEAYLTALFVYFERVARATTSDGDSDYPIIFTLRTGVDGTPKDILLGPMTVVYEPSPTTAPAFLGIPDGACVISANKNVGFGQSASQEEMHVGCSPECCPIVLFTPTLRDKEVLVVQGPEAMVAIKGYGRDARVDEFQAGQHLKWARRTMLFMDALELDWYDNRDQLPDLLPGNVDRELCKAYTAFSSRNDAYSHIVTGLWGCRSFGGNSDIKTLIQWCAASMAGVPLHFVCAGADQQDFASQLARIVEHGRKHAWRAESILGHLRALRPDNARARSVFAHLMQSLDNRN